MSGRTSWLVARLFWEAGDRTRLWKECLFLFGEQPATKVRIEGSTAGAQKNEALRHSDIAATVKWQMKDCSLVDVFLLAKPIASKVVQARKISSVCSMHSGTSTTEQLALRVFSGRHVRQAAGVSACCFCRAAAIAMAAITYTGQLLFGRPSLFLLGFLIQWHLQAKGDEI